MRPAAARAVALVMALACAGVAGCAGGGGSEDTSPTTAAAGAPTSTSVATAPETSPPAGRAGGLPCDGQAFLDVMRDEGGQFDLSPAVLGELRPEGPPQCDAAFARQSFVGPPGAAEPYAALFAVRPDGSGWGLVSVNCLSSVSSGQRQVC